MRVIRGAWSDETDACAGKAKRPIALVEAKADCVTERDIQSTTVLCDKVGRYRIYLNSSRGYYLFQPRASAATNQEPLLYEDGSYFKDRARTSFLTRGNYNYCTYNCKNDYRWV